MTWHAWLSILQLNFVEEILGFVVVRREVEPVTQSLQINVNDDSPAMQETQDTWI